MAGFRAQDRLAPTSRITPTAARLRSTNSITLSAALLVVEVARAKATELGVPMNIVVVDAGGNLVAFARMERGVSSGQSASVAAASTRTTTSRTPALRRSDVTAARRPGRCH
jgi:uncharacterized protein GlcG (DUF336 family)